MIPRRGFTLLELMAVLVLMTLLTGVISLSLAGVSKQTSIQDAAGAITDMDRSMRLECTEFNRKGEIRFDLESQKVTRIAHREEGPIEVESYQLPNTLHMKKLWVQSQTGQPQLQGVVVIQCDSHGRTPTYAVSVKPYSQDSDIQSEVDVPGVFPEIIPGVIAGMTGHIQECKNEIQVNDLFEALAWRHTD